MSSGACSFPAHSVAAPIRQTPLRFRHDPTLVLPATLRSRWDFKHISFHNRSASSATAEDIRQPQPYDAFVWGNPDAAPVQQLAPCTLSKPKNASQLFLDLIEVHVSTVNAQL